MGDPLKQRNNFWNKQQLSSSHYTTDDLRRSAYNNYLYTNKIQPKQLFPKQESDSIIIGQKLSKIYLTYQISK